CLVETETETTIVGIAVAQIHTGIRCNRDHGVYRHQWAIGANRVLLTDRSVALFPGQAALHVKRELQDGGAIPDGRFGGSLRDEFAGLLRAQFPPEIFSVYIAMPVPDTAVPSVV